MRVQNMKYLSPNGPRGDHFSVPSPPPPSPVSTPSPVSDTPARDLSTPRFNSPCDTPTPTMKGGMVASKGHGDMKVDKAKVDSLIDRYLASAQYKSAQFWADKRLTLNQKNGEATRLVDMAEYVQVLARVGDLTRLRLFLESNDLAMKHIFFTYFYVLALFQKKCFQKIVDVTTYYSKDFVNPAESNHLISTRLNSLHCSMPDRDETQELDQMCDDLKLESGLLTLLGKTYMLAGQKKETRLCLQKALTKDPCCEEAIRILHSNNLLSETEFKTHVDRASLQVCGLHNALSHFSIMDGSQQQEQHNEVESSTPSCIDDDIIRTARAHQHYRVGKVREANQITTQIMEQAGICWECVPLHVATLVGLHKADELFRLGNTLVDNEPDNSLTWYVVGCYYFSIHQMQSAKRFFDKCINMNPWFGEGYLAAGLTIGYSVDGFEQSALPYLLKAAKLLDGRFEPLMYIGLEHCFMGNPKTGVKFLENAVENCEGNPLVVHEQGCLLYYRRMWKKAEERFERALRMTYNAPDDCDVMILLCNPLDESWLPLVSNLGHAKRRLHKYADALTCHQKVKAMRPSNSTAIAALAVEHAALGHFDQAILHCHQVLSKAPKNGLMKRILESIFRFTDEHGYPVIDVEQNSQNEKYERSVF